MLVYSLRSLKSVLMAGFAFLDRRYLLGDEPMPDYHLGHTLILKLYPVLKRLEENPGFESVFASKSHHREMIDDLFTLFFTIFHFRRIAGRRL